MHPMRLSEIEHCFNVKLPRGDYILGALVGRVTLIVPRFLWLGLEGRRANRTYPDERELRHFLSHAASARRLSIKFNLWHRRNLRACFAGHPAHPIRAKPSPVAWRSFLSLAIWARISHLLPIRSSRFSRSASGPLGAPQPDQLFPAAQQRLEIFSLGPAHAVSGERPVQFAAPALVISQVSRSQALMRAKVKAIAKQVTKTKKPHNLRTRITLTPYSLSYEARPL